MFNCLILYLDWEYSFIPTIYLLLSTALDSNGKQSLLQAVMLICDRTEGVGKASMLKSVFIFKLIIWLVCDAQIRIQLALTTEGQFFFCAPHSAFWNCRLQ